jgi:hypothetical protein
MSLTVVVQHLSAAFVCSACDEVTGQSVTVKRLQTNLLATTIGTITHASGKMAETMSHETVSWHVWCICIFSQILSHMSHMAQLTALQVSC